MGAYKCPMCASADTNVVGGAEFVDADTYLDHYRCMTCKTKWQNTFTHAQQIDVEPGPEVNLDGLNDVAHPLIIVKFISETEGSHYTVYNGACESEVAAEDQRNWEGVGQYSLRFNTASAIKVTHVDVLGV